MKMLNLTQHNATNEQLELGVVEPSESEKVKIKELLTFDDIPTAHEMINRAIKLVGIVGDYDNVMIGGAPYFMPVLEQVLIDYGKHPYYAFSKRATIEKETEQGVEKVSVFKHVGFVEGCLEYI